MADEMLTMQRLLLGVVVMTVVNIRTLN